jgi:hypothetical protein
MEVFMKKRRKVLVAMLASLMIGAGVVGFAACQTENNANSTSTQQSQAHVHSYDQEVAESDYLKEKGTCIRKAVYYKSCTCGLVSETETFEYGNEMENILILERHEMESESDLIKDVLDDNENHQITVVDLHDEEAIPRTLDGLIEYDQIILVNVAYSDMPEGFDEVLNSYVYDMGGSLFTVGGNKENGEANTYDRADMYGTLYQEMLPVQAINYTPPVGVVFIVDTSGSMAMTDGSGSTNIDWAKAAATAGLDALTERDYVGIVTFDSVGEEVLPMTSIVNESSILKAIDSIMLNETEGVFHNAISKAGQMLGAFESAAKRHIIMITDGAFVGEEEQYGALVKNYYDTYGITFSVMGLGISSNELEAIESGVELGCGRLYNATGADLIRLMREELRTPEIKDVNYETFSLEILPEYAELYGISSENQLTLDGFYGTKLKKEATAIVTGVYNLPIYAQWNYGKGIVGSFMCDLNGEWSNELLKNPNGRRLINALICRGINS